MTKSFPSLIIVRRAALILGLAVIAALALFASEVWAQKPPVAEKPLNLTGQVVAGGIQLNWEAPAARAAEVDGYQVYRRRPDQGETLLLVLVANTGSTATSYLDATATEPGVSYIYRVRAWRGTELSRMANKLQLTYTAPEPAPEPIPAPTLETTPTPDPITTLDPEPAGVTVELGDITDLEAAQFATGELDGGADTVHTYRFTLSEPKKLGLGLRQQETNADLLVVDAEGVELRAARKPGAANEWITVTLLAGNYEARIEAQEAGDSTYVLRYGVEAPNAAALQRLLAEQQEPEPEPVIATQQQPTPAELAPSNLSAESTAGGVQLAWDAPAADAALVSGYRISRTHIGAKGGEDLTDEIETGSTDLSYLDAAANIEGAIYGYRVSALRDGLASEASSDVTVVYIGDVTKAITYVPPPAPEWTAPESSLRHTVNSERILVSNRELTSPSTRTLELDVESFTSFDLAQKFTTGSNQTGYQLSHVKIKISEFHTGDELSVYLSSAVPIVNYSVRKAPYEDFVASYGPAPRFALELQLESPSSLANGVLLYRVPNNQKLQPHTDYFIHIVANSAKFKLETINSGDEASAGLTGWLIQDFLVQADEVVKEIDWGFNHTVLSMTLLGVAIAPQAFASDEHAVILAANTPGQSSYVGTGGTRYSARRYKATNQHSDIAQKFTTGANQYPYELSYVELAISDTDPGERIVAHLHDGQGLSTPGGRLATFEYTDTTGAAWLNGHYVALRAPVGTTLTPNTEYFLVVEAAPKSYNDHGMEILLGTLGPNKFSAQAELTGDWEFAEYLLNDEAYGIVVRIAFAEDEQPLVDWITGKRWSLPTRGTLLMRFAGTASQPITVQQVGVLERVGKLIVTWQADDRADEYKVQWRRLDQTWPQAVFDGQEALRTRYNMYLPGPDTLGAPGYAITNLEQYVYYEIRVLGLQDKYPGLVQSTNLVIGATRPATPAYIGPDLTYFVQTIGLPSEDTLGATALPTEEIPFRPNPAFQNEIIAAEGDVWSPSGLWGDSDTDVIWVVDTTHFGVHSLKLSELQAGVVERHVAPDLDTLDLRMIQGCHFTRQHSGRNGNYELSAIWGDDETIWVANGARGRLDAYQRVDTVTDGFTCTWKEITDWGSYDTEQRSFRSGLPRNKSKDYSLWLTNNDYINVNGIWSDGATIWLSGPVARVVPNARPPLTAGIYKLDMSSGRLSLATGYEDLSESAGIWSDGTTMWVARPGRLKAYNLADGARRANLDVGLHWGRDPGDIWSDGETIWVTNFGLSAIEAYRLPKP